MIGVKKSLPSSMPWCTMPKMRLGLFIG
uniref:Uncharacterized protein n=1 Tax=Arundo donax TaxID=35708 RepID=A0A0A8ZME5_ARUDO